MAGEELRSLIIIKPDPEVLKRLWESPEGQKLRKGIEQRMLANMAPYLGPVIKRAS